MRRRRLSALVLGIATVTATVGGLPGSAGAATVPKAANAKHTNVLQAIRAEQAGAVTVTLITGDRVVTIGHGVSVQPGPGRGHIHFLSQTIKGERYVIPSDALALLRSGRVDRRLFDVTALAASGYDDRGAALPLLVAYPGAANRKLAASATSVGGARVTRDLTSVGMLAVSADRASRPSLWSSLTSGTAPERSLRAGVERIWLDGKRKISLDHSVPQIGAPEAWKAGFDGAGVTVAILDTGIDATHPDLAGQIAGTQNFTDTPSTDDTVGHGTHVASIIAGTGAASNGRYRGVAPGAKLLIGKVCGTESCDDSDILAGMEWAASRAKVINMSLGGGDSPEIDPLEQAVNDLTAKYGALFVIAAGNDGRYAPVSSPATADAALAVGAVDSDDKLADFSSRGPRVGDGAIKPDITAPGVDIVAAKAKNGVIGDPAPVDGYTTLSGTSMATPHVAGAAAILTQEHSAWSPAQRKTVLMGAAQPTAGVNPFGQGAGRVDVARAIKQSVSIDDGSLSFGLQRWPHGDDVPQTKTVTYRNYGTAPVTLALALSTDAPAGTFKASATSLTVPAGGTATTTVTADTRVDGPDGVRSGYLTATAPGGVRVETPIAVTREVESYDVTLLHTNRDGTPSDSHLTALTNLVDGSSFYSWQAKETLRVPKGEYGVFSWLDVGYDTDDTADDSTTMLVQTKLVIGKATTLRLDARSAKSAKVTVPAKDAVDTLASVTASWTSDSFTNGATLFGGSFDGIYLGQIGSKAPVAGFLGSVNSSKAKKSTGPMFRNTPYTYDLAYFAKGTFFDGLRKTVRSRDLATIKARYATEATGVEGVKFNAGVLTPDDGYAAALIPFDLPFRRTEYVNVDSGALWLAEFDQQVPAVGDEFPEVITASTTPATALRAGRTYQQQWNRAVFAPSAAGSIAQRSGDLIEVGFPLFTEGSGHIGFSKVDAARIALYSGGKLIKEFPDQFGEFEVPAAAGAYQLELSATRSAPHTLSTSVSAVWTFRSSHVEGEQPQALSLPTIQISPRLDERNVAPAGRRLVVPLTLSSPARSVTAEVSFDDGHTWRQAQVSGSGARRAVTVRNPGAAGFASLRIHATDRSGSTVTQTVIRAYAIG